MEYTKTPKQVAFEEVSKRVVSFDEAKERYKQWLSSSLSIIHGLSDSNIDFWNEVLIEIDKLTPSPTAQNPQNTGGNAGEGVGETK